MTARGTTAVLGTGSWGTTFAAVLADAGNDVTVWGRSAETCREITREHHNERYLPGVELPHRVTATTDIRTAVARAELVAVAVPSQVARAVLAEVADALEPDAVVVSLMKGVEPGTGERMSEVVREVLGLEERRVAVVSGPNLAREIADHQPTATVVAAVDEATAARVAHACAAPYFRPYTNTDVVGVELGGAVKNVIALAVGMAQGVGYGDNTTASLITRGLAETTRLGLALGARAETLAGLAGMGDLVATCSSRLSRNHTLGRHIGEGMTLEQAVAATGGTAEGVRSCRAVLELADAHGVDMPISRAVAAVLYENLPVPAMTEALLSRPRRAEGR
ncbi:NAD(P)H-dependent glycerol-3-phosphate dehydrogenase [uncultured Georgenia sp.]|uniref:NAD(P)H-dependent glycerol-3-phosphate dehydrogenase n=1 Tax=uncultured Georgenia sp. TaxID=378209 RepID=UPI002622A46A|nr:NAD(P)H-dependent glycerol-3-phosphate dehydrogenase [uncultured Georgenia sp.]HLV04741.1 NAD(P)H-dependent glycerol-3-phosphate dehydrogenase [Actinomycetaceae bacterium]